MFKTSHLRFWLANKSYHMSQIGRTISQLWLYHQSWTIDCQISCFWSYNWSYPLTIGRAISHRTSLWLNMQLRTTCADWLHDLCRLMQVLLSYDHSHDLSCDSLQQVAKTNGCMRSKFCISPNIHDRLYVLQIDRNRTTKKSYDPVWLKP